jgi:hypothetical protein
MPNTVKKMFRGAASTSSATLYTVPALTTAVVTNITICNTSATTGTATILLDDTAIVSALPLSGNTVTSIDMRQVVLTTGTIKGLASAVTMNFHISGIEVS